LKEIYGGSFEPIRGLSFIKSNISSVFTFSSFLVRS